MTIRLVTGRIACGLFARLPDIYMDIQHAECWWGAAEGSGEGAAPPPQQKEILLYILYHAGLVICELRTAKWQTGKM